MQARRAFALSVRKAARLSLGFGRVGGDLAQKFTCCDGVLVSDKGTGKRFAAAVELQVGG